MAEMMNPMSKPIMSMRESTISSKSMTETMSGGGEIIITLPKPRECMINLVLVVLLLLMLTRMK